ncbi:putative mitochondrial protein [Dendrobium catenatum]|uniref:Putative mitochondrial protein n=1 Tax=Dendrobium catenatum TaxID=906689 RepID=A0A2I0WE64_9ASPA|nr:putative mitochondrial protein [Dendrobium catenatum]
MNKMISEEQLAFIPGRSMSDHCILAQEIFHKFKVSKNKKGLMAAKLDMEQAYDSMGWSTLQQILVWYGFPSIFSKFVTECVLNVRFAIIMNGKKRRWIDACSGFCQGCPLSPYLFIMCAQLLSNAIMQRGHSLGIQLASRGPRITHLLYVEDVLIFSQANYGMARQMLKIMEEFGKWTGLKVNANKSQILFGKSVRKTCKKKHTRILGFKALNEWKYLGIKMSISKLKAADYQDLLAQVLEKLNVWGRRNISLGGRIMLLKSSLLNLPNFVITHSMVPKIILQEIERLCRNFI